MNTTIKVITTKESGHHHGNCVPFILTNHRTNHIVYMKSLKEVASKLRITQGHASVIHRNNIRYRGVYSIQRMPFNSTVTFS